VPGDWLRVGYAPDRASPCPPGFLEADLTADPDFGADTCVCESCQITSPPDCTSGQVYTQVDDSDGVCHKMGLTLSNNPPGSCLKLQSNGSGIYLADHASITPPGPFGGACSLSAAPNKSQVKWTEGRVCIPDAEGCEFELCAAPGAFTECIMTEGDMSCPAPYSMKHTVGNDTMITCGACPCTVEASCTGALEVYTDSLCTAQKVVFPANGSCTASNSDAVYYRYKYVGAIKEMDCASEPPAAAIFIHAQTLCCKQ
jgi:hypothetical protein